MEKAGLKYGGPEDQKILFKLGMICDCKKDSQKNPNNLEVLKEQVLDLVSFPFKKSVLA